MSEKTRLDRFISNANLGSRKEVKNFIRNHLITVNGMIVKNASLIIDCDNDIVYCNGKEVKYTKYVYIMLNKPKGVVCANIDNVDKTVIDILPKEMKRSDIFVAGRLDKDTEGFVLITNNGNFSHNILSPKKHISKTYFAHIKGIVTNDDVKKFKEGVIIDKDYKCMPAYLKIINSGDISYVEITICEGKFHQIKKMFTSVKKEVIYLKRIKIGGLSLDENLKIGEARYITNFELSKIREVKL